MVQVAGHSPDNGGGSTGIDAGAQEVRWADFLKQGYQQKPGDKPYSGYGCEISSCRPCMLA